MSMATRTDGKSPALQVADSQRFVQGFMPTLARPEVTY
jgi:hypothetical protein